MRNILEFIKDLEDENGLIEYNGQTYTPEELAIHLTLTGQFEIVDREEVSWFEKVMNDLEKEETEQ